MTYATLTPEGIARNIKSLYENGYNDVLDTVEAAWASTEDITLTDFEVRAIVADPGNIKVFSQYPALAIGVGNLREDNEADQQVQLYTSYYLLDIQLVYFLKGIDTHQLGIIVLRHQEATLRFFQQYPRLGYGSEVSIRNLELEPSENVFSSGGNTLVKGLRVRFDVRFLQRGF